MLKPEQPELVHYAEPKKSIEDTLLTKEDLEWLNKLTRVEIAEEDLVAINEIVRNDVAQMRDVSDEHALEDARAARKLFYEDVLGWNDESSPYHSSYEAMKEIQSNNDAVGRPLAGFIPALRKLHELGIDVSKVAKGYPDALTRSATHIQDVYDTISGLGLDVDKMMRISPGTPLRCSPQMIKEHFDLLSDCFSRYGLSAKDVLERAPFVLGNSVVAVETHMDNFKNLGLDARLLVQSKPTILSQSPASVRKRFLFLADRGLNAAKLIRRAPGILEYSEERLVTNIQFLETKGLDVSMVTFKAPTILALSPDNIQHMFDTLTEYGLDPVEIINRSATIATYNADTIRSKISFMQALLDTLDTSVDAPSIIKTYPDILSHDVNKMFFAARFAHISGKKFDNPTDIVNVFRLSVDETMLRHLNGSDGSITTIPKKTGDHHALVMEQLMNPNLRARLGKLGMVTFIDHVSAKGKANLSPGEKAELLGSMTQNSDSITRLPIVAS